MPEKKINGFIFYRGPSALNGKPIVAIATGLTNARRHSGKANRKTGAMVQTYILSDTESPVAARHSGGDAAICGDCPHRNGTCYVRLEQGPTIVFKALQAGRYPLLSPEEASKHVAGLPVRLGAYGDAVAVPFGIWQSLLVNVSGLTGYTHQWRLVQAEPFQAYCMASCDSASETMQARQLGWRTFTVVSKVDWQRETKALPKTFLCPASEEAGKKLTCSDCLACDGLFSQRKAHVSTPVHGVAFKVKRFESTLIQIGRA